MRYAIPFSLTVFDSLVVQYSLSPNQKYYFEKFTQLDSSILREYNFTQLTKLYKGNRQTVTDTITSLCSKKLLLEINNRGFIVSIPTYSGFIGIFTNEYNNIYRFILSIPETNITYSIDIFKGNIKELALSKLKIGQCYYLVGKIKSDKEDNFLNLLDLDKVQYHISFSCMTLTDCYLLEEIGFRYDNNNFVSLNNKELNS